MFRRDFMQKITVAGAASIGVATAEEASSVSFRVKGFTCVGCDPDRQQLHDERRHNPDRYRRGR